MNKYFDETKVEELYPEAGELMMPPMLIWKPTKVDDIPNACGSGEYFAQLKKDGACYQYVRTANHSYLFGRTVSQVTGLLTEKSANIPHIISALEVLPANTIIVGEIYYPGGTSKNVTTIMGCLPAKARERQKNNPIHFYCHDMIYYDGEDMVSMGAWERYQKLREVWEKYNLSQYDFLELAAAVREDIEVAISNALSSGEEGMVLKKDSAPYTPGTRPARNTMKVKQMDTIDLVCTRTIPATREYTGKELEAWPYWEMITNEYEDSNLVVFTTDINQYGNPGWEPVTKPYFLGWHTSIGIGAYDANGNLKELGTVSSGFTDEDRENMAKNDYTGMVVSLSCMSIDRVGKTLRHPVFKAWRPDKNATECTIEAVF